MTWEKILGLTVIGACVTTAGTLLGLVLKERFFARSFERWKAHFELISIARRYREPIALAAIELCNRLMVVADEYPTNFLTASVLTLSAPQRPTLNSAADPYFRRYRLVSTIYRLCAFFAWIELYRQETTYLEPDETGRTRAVDTAIFAVRSDLADGQLNEATDWSHWHDALVFREEQRAIGESMIVAVGSQRSVMGYGEFAELYPGAGSTRQERWFTRAAAFLLDLEPRKDFRETRVQRLVVHLVDLAELLAPSRVRTEHREARQRYASVVSAA